MSELFYNDVFHPKFFDKNGNLKPNSWDDDSENPNTINNVAAIMAWQLHMKFRSPQGHSIADLNFNKHDKNRGECMTNEGDADKFEKEWEESNIFRRFGILVSLARSSNRMSHDEINGVSMGSFYFLTIENAKMYNDYEKHEKNLYMVPENTKQTWYRSYDVGAQVKYAKRFWRDEYQGGAPTHLLWQVAQFCELACKDTSKDNRGEYHASGKQQAWLRLNGLGMVYDFEVCTMLLPELDGWIEVFRNYYPEEDHPINIMARALYAA